jgi:hypothetical protein
VGPEGVKARRDEVVHAKEEELRGVVDGHDNAVLEKFHLERYISLLEGWDPVVNLSVQFDLGRELTTSLQRQNRHQSTSTYVRLEPGDRGMALTYSTNAPIIICSISFLRPPNP